MCTGQKQCLTLCTCWLGKSIRVPPDQRTVFACVYTRSVVPRFLFSTHNSMIRLHLPRSTKIEYPQIRVWPQVPLGWPSASTPPPLRPRNPPPPTSLVAPSRIIAKRELGRRQWGEKGPPVAIGGLGGGPLKGQLGRDPRLGVLNKK